MTVAGWWCYVYRASDSEGNLVETMQSKTRDRDAAKRFVARALETVDEAPETVTTAGHDSSPRAVRETLGPDVCHRTSRSMNNRIEHDHPRHHAALRPPARVLAPPGSAARVCTAHDDLRDYLRPRTRCNEAISLAEQRRLFQERWGAVCALLRAA